MQSSAPATPNVTERRVVLLEKENVRLLKLVEKLGRENAELRGEEGGSQLELARLKENLDRAMNRLYGDSSERLDVKPPEPPPEPRDRPARGHGPRSQPKLPIEEVVVELEGDERCCPSCSGDLEEMNDQFEESEQISVIERVYYVKKVKRQKYRCRCQSAVVTAPAQLTHLPGGRYSLDFAAQSAVDKYIDHLPLDRQTKRMARQGLEVTSQSLWDQLDALASLLEPVHEELRKRVCASKLVHADETPWRLFGQRKGSRRYAWSISNGDSIYFDFLRGRGADDAAAVLEGFEGDLVCDGYISYESLSLRNPKIRLVACWAHIRRKYKDAEKGFPKESRQALEQIAQLYQLEHLRPDLRGLEGDELDEARELDALLREHLQRVVIHRLREWAYSVRASKESGLAKAVKHMLGRWTELTRFLDDPDLPLDNNQAERSLRGPVVGRKIHYGSRSRDGCRVGGCFYSLLETCKLHGVDPHRYLIEAVKAIVETGTVLLPQDLR